MTVVFLINSLAGGGAEKQLLLTAAALSRCKVNCHVFTLQAGVPHQRLRRWLDAAASQGVWWHQPPTGRLGGLIQASRVWAFLSRKRGAILWTWGHRADLVHLGLLGIGLRPRTIVGLRSADRERLHRYRWLWRLIAASTEAFASNTWLNVEQLEEIVPNVGARSAVIYNAIDDEIRCAPPVVLGVRPARLRIVMLGNVLPQVKGYDLLLPLAQRIREHRLPWTVHVGGALVDATGIVRSLADEGLQDIVRFEGAVSDPLSFLSSGDVFLMLSRVEGMPNALIEAMSLSLPSVCTKVGDVPRFARDGEHLRLIEVGDASGAFGALNSLWKDWSAAVELGRRGRELCLSTFAADRMLGQTLALLRAVAAGSADRSPL